MRTLLIALAILAAAPHLACADTAVSAKSGFSKIFKIYSDSNSPDNHYAPSGWMGDWKDLKVEPANTENPHGGSTAIRVEYLPKKSQGANWAGIYWQNPPNNWGGKPGGFDLTGATKLVFWARGAKGGEELFEVRTGGITGEYPDSDVAGMGPVALTKDWKKYEIDLTGKDLSSISGGFMWSANLDGNPQGFTVYFDDIYFE